MRSQLSTNKRSLTVKNHDNNPRNKKIVWSINGTQGH